VPDVGAHIEKVVADVNRAVSSRLLELLDFLPTQKPVLSVSFSKDRTEYEMEIVHPDHSAAVVFYSRKEISGVWRSIFRTPHEWEIARQTSAQTFLQAKSWKKASRTGFPTCFRGSE